MSETLIVGLDGGGSGERALAHAKRLAGLIGDCTIEVIYVIEWSPFSFQTAEENETRHKRREEEIETAMSRVIDPAVAALKKEGFSASGQVRHGDAAEILDTAAKTKEACQIIVARASEVGFAQKLFGSVTANLVMNASVPVTVVG